VLVQNRGNSVGRESNLRCKCGEPLFATENMRHTYYICLNCRNVYAVKGTDHYMHVDEIDSKTGKITQFVPSKKRDTKK